MRISLRGVADAFDRLARAAAGLGLSLTWTLYPDAPLPARSALLAGCLARLAAALLAIRGHVWPLLAVFVLITGWLTVLTRHTPSPRLLPIAAASLLALWALVRRGRAPALIAARTVLAAAVVAVFGGLGALSLVGLLQARSPESAHWSDLAVEPEAPVPPPSPRTLDGERITLDDPGKLYVLDFMTVGCKPCLAELPALARLQRKLHRLGVAEILFVIGPTPEEGVRILRERAPGALFAVGEDDWGGRKVGVHAFPTEVFLYRGRVVDADVGAVSLFPAGHLERRIRAVLARRSNAPPGQRSRTASEASAGRRGPEGGRP
ncbi:MAG: TlpA family protein disulfide reductase [Acidobacteria bacterium]|nr:MAG: TlpA family protein disulfide reductase [Acidobacteriota bacterium]